MDLNVWRWTILLLGALLQFGCATTADTASDTPPDLSPAPSKEDDSHGWGANIKGM